MARIRTIKPEFPQSESLGRCSRDARLLFVLLLTLADDSGRSRGDSRFLARTLFPYDEDVTSDAVESWLVELDREHIRRYRVDGCTYLEIRNWLSHQRIDHPAASKIPPFREDSREPREDSRGTPLGLDWIGLEGIGEERAPADAVAVRSESPKPEKPKKPEPPTIPPALDTPEFRAAWDDWLTHHRQKRSTLTPIAAKKQLAKLAKMGLARAIAALEHSTGQSWTGLFEPDAKRGGPTAKAQPLAMIGKAPDPPAVLSPEEQAERDKAVAEYWERQRSARRERVGGAA